MKNKNKVLIALIIVVIIILIILGNILKNSKNNSNDKIKILTSFYPIYIMTLNITEDVQNIEVGNMAEHLTGCIHDYTLEAEDLKKFENANIFIQHGAGLESFTDKIISSYPNVRVINAADNITNFVYDDEGESNSHIWLSLENYVEEVRTISDALCKLDQENKELYEENTNKYINKLDDLRQKFSELNLSNKKAICLNESLEYLLTENGINETLIETDHDQASLSANMVKVIIEKMNKEDIKNIFIDKDDDTKTANMLADETGAKIYVLNSAMNGNIDKNSYINAMEENYKVLESIQ